VTADLAEPVPRGSAGHYSLFPAMLPVAIELARFPAKRAEATVDGWLFGPKDRQSSATRAQRFAARTCDGERAVRLLRLSPERFCDDR
jgi:hypothetical protein